MPFRYAFESVLSPLPKQIGLCQLDAGNNYFHFVYLKLQDLQQLKYVLLQLCKWQLDVDITLQISTASSILIPIISRDNRGTKDKATAGQLLHSLRLLLILLYKEVFQEQQPRWRVGTGRRSSSQPLNQCNQDRLVSSNILYFHVYRPFS